MSVEKDEITQPKSLVIKNYPNPFNSSTRIHYEILEDGFINLDLYNCLGEKVKSIVSNYKKAGSYEITFRGNNLTSGVYVIVLKTNKYLCTHKLLLLK